MGKLTEATVLCIQQRLNYTPVQDLWRNAMESLEKENKELQRKLEEANLLLAQKELDLIRLNERAKTLRSEKDEVSLFLAQKKVEILEHLEALERLYL